MAKFNKVQVITAMRETGMVPVFYNSDPEVVKNVVKACYDGPQKQRDSVPSGSRRGVHGSVGAARRRISCPN